MNCFIRVTALLEYLDLEIFGGGSRAPFNPLPPVSAPASNFIKNVILWQQPSPFENLKSSYLQAKFIEENFPYVVRILVV